MSNITDNRLYQDIVRKHKQIYWIGLVLAISTCMLFNMSLTNDVWFMISHARHMLADGFYPGTDVLSLHENFDFVYQKWAMCFLSYFVYENFGRAGLYAGCYVLYGLFNASLYVLLNKLNPKSLFCNLPLVLLVSLCSATYMNFRPHVIAGILIIWEIYVLEQYVSCHMKTFWFYVQMFVISLVLMWFHSTMWYMVLIPVLPYLFDGMIHLSRVTAATHSRLPLVLSFPAMIFAACLQPNGLYQFKYMYVCLTAAGEKYSHIDELAPFYETKLYVVGMIAMLIFGLVVVWHNKRVLLRSLYWVFGAVLMSVVSGRLMFYGFIFMAVAYASDMREYWVRGDYKHPTNHMLYECIYTTAFTLVVLLLSFDICSDYFKPEHIGTYEGIYDGLYIIETMNDNLDMDGLRLFTTSEVGSYSTIYGAKPYYDCRAEVYDKALNHQSDVIVEFVDVCHDMADGAFSVEDAKAFQEKYDFDYWILSKDILRAGPVLEEAGAVCNHPAGDDKHAVYSFKHTDRF